MLRRIVKPFAGSGTNSMLARWWGGASGLVTTIAIANPAPSAPVLNHLVPLIT